VLRSEVAEVTKTYTAVFTRDENGAWIVRVPAVPGCHTYGLSLRQARQRIREALSLFLDDAEAARIEDDIRLPARTRATVERAKRARERADRERETAQRETERSVQSLVRLGLSTRDAGDLLGLSHQRVQQLVRG